MKKRDNIVFAVMGVTGLFGAMTCSIIWTFRVSYLLGFFTLFVSLFVTALWLDTD